jgi:EmrB/QacA subfamily drug resistance transporter
MPDMSSTAAPLAPAEIRRIIFGLMMAMLLAALDQTIVATALPTIGRDLGDAVHLPWVVTAYLLSATSAVPIYGKLSDIHGRRIMLLIAISTFLVGSVLCALAPSMLVLIAARFIQGAGGGGLLALSQTIVGDMLSPRERAGYQVYFATAFTTASLGGPVLGGFFAQHLTWSMIFWINVPLGIADFLMTNNPLRRLPRHERKQRLDVPGAILLVASTSTLLMALSWAGARYGWASVPTIAIFALSAALFAGFYYRLRHTAEPLIPLEVLFNTVVLTATGAATLSVGLFLGLAIYTPILFESVRGLTASQSGIALLPLMVGTVGGTLMAGRAMAHLEHYKVLPLVCLPFAGVAALLLMAASGSMPVWALSLVLGVISVALGTLLPISTVSIQNAVALHQLGTATATANLFRQLGGAVMVAIFGTIVLGAGATAAVATVDPADRLALLGAFHTVFGIVALGVVAAFVTILAMEERPLSGPSRAAAAESLSPGE